MSGRRVHALLAAGLDNPALIEALRLEPDRLRRYGLEPGSLDLAVVQKLAGLTAKVRHNGLRDKLPMTFRLLSVEELEIDIFAAYALQVSREGRRFAPTTVGRMSDFIAFVGTWLDRANRTHLLLWDLVRHEHGIVHLTALHDEPPPEATSTARPSGVRSAPGVPFLRGEVVLHEMTSDPQVTIGKLHGRKPDLRGIPLGERHVAYWSPRDRYEIRVLDLDELGYYALGQVDGQATVLEIDRALGGRGRSPRKGLLRRIEQLAAIGIIGFDEL